VLYSKNRRYCIKKPYFIRRSRGYAPFPIILSQKASTSVLSTGGELKNTFCLYRDHEAFLSPHIGDLENYASFKSFEEGITHFQKIFGIEPKIVSYDPHPGYLSTQYAMKLAILQGSFMAFSPPGRGIYFK